MDWVCPRKREHTDCIFQLYWYLISICTRELLGITRMPPRDFAFWAKSQAAIVFVIFLDFHSIKHGLPHWLTLDLMALTKIKCIPIVIHLSSCTPLWIHYSTWSKHVGKWRDRRRENTLPVFFFFFFFVNEHNNTKMKPQTKNQRFLKLSQKRNSSCWKKTMQVI